MNIPFLLERALQLYANKEALVAGEKRFSYAEFAQRIYRLSNLLQTRGISKGDCVAILQPNDHCFLEAYFAVAQLGAILNPLNTRLSPHELALILQDSSASILIASKQFTPTVEQLATLKSQPAHVIWTGEGKPLPEGIDYEEALQSQPTQAPTQTIHDEGIAHLYYTSGTTGKPKGVILTHKNVCTHALATIAELQLTDRDNWLHAAPLFHLADAWATFAITWVGAKHVTLPRFVPSAALQLIQQEKITITNMIPTMLNALVHEPTVSSYNLSPLRALLSGGAPIAPELVRKIIALFQCDYIQTYGMTETSPYLTFSLLKENLHHLPQEEQLVYKAKTGRPMIGILLKVVRENGEEVKANEKEVGEIIVKGDIVTPGYWNRPEETKAAIREGWLYTGDLAVVDQQGYVTIVDRKKDMIVTGGENVYSTEVEHVLYTHPAILEAAVIGVPDPQWGEAVKAVVALQPEHSASEQEIIAYCKEKIAHYKAPKSVSFLAELPKTGSGKIYKKGLKEN